MAIARWLLLGITLFPLACSPEEPPTPRISPEEPPGSISRLIPTRTPLSVTLTAGGKTYQVCVGGRVVFFTDGDDIRQLDLLDSEGRLLDSLACWISARVTMFVDGPQFATDVLANPAPEDGAQIVIRLTNNGARGGGDHRLTHRGTALRFYWSDEVGVSPSRPPAPTIYDEKGLCRLIVKNDRLEVIFPPPEYASPEGFRRLPPRRP